MHRKPSLKVSSKRTHIKRQRVRLPWKLVDAIFQTKDIAVASDKKHLSGNLLKTSWKLGFKEFPPM